MHWFLLVVDLDKHQLILLDSKPCSAKKESRKRSIKILVQFTSYLLKTCIHSLQLNYVNLKPTTLYFVFFVQALYLEVMLLDVSFYEFESTTRPKISDFALVEPDDIRVQKEDS